MGPKNSKNKLLFHPLLLIIFLIFALKLGLAANLKVKVTVEKADIRLKPDITSQIIAKVVFNTVLESEGKVGSWYRVNLPPDENGFVISGYVHENMVEIVKEIKEVPKEEKPPEITPPAVKEPPVKEEKPPPIEPRYALRRRAPQRAFSFKAGGLFYLVQAGYDYQFSYPYLNETFTITDSVTNASAIGFDFGIGIFISKNIEITADVNYFSKGLKGDFSMSLPNPYWDNDIAHDEITTEPALKEFIFSFGFNFYPSVTGNVRPYFGAGASYVNGKMDLVEDGIYHESYSYWSSGHSLTIASVEFKETSINKFGFNLRGGIDYSITDMIYAFAEGKYIIAKKEVPHPMTSEYFEEEKLDINLGGGSFSLGIRLFF